MYLFLLAYLRECITRNNLQQTIVAAAAEIYIFGKHIRPDICTHISNTTLFFAHVGYQQQKQPTTNSFDIHKKEHPKQATPSFFTFDILFVERPENKISSRLKNIQSC